LTDASDASGKNHHFLKIIRRTGVRQMNNLDGVVLLANTVVWRTVLSRVL
jgi:hypothetical protein